MDREVLETGDRIRDNDPREPGRVLLVKGFFQKPTGQRYARCIDAAKCERDILLSRIFCDEKPRRTGFSLIQEHNSAVAVGQPPKV